MGRLGPRVESQLLGASQDLNPALVSGRRKLLLYQTYSVFIDGFIDDVRLESSSSASHRLSVSCHQDDHLTDIQMRQAQKDLNPEYISN